MWQVWCPKKGIFLRNTIKKISRKFIKSVRIRSYGVHAIWRVCFQCGFKTFLYAILIAILTNSHTIIRHSFVCFSFALCKLPYTISKHHQYEFCYFYLFCLADIFFLLSFFKAQYILILMALQTPIRSAVSAR